MKNSFGILLFVLIAGCSPKVDVDKLPKLNGYWEIEKVVFPDGSTKTYEVNASVDFIQINGKEGFRKKMQPQFDGSFRTSDDAERFTVIDKSGILIMSYANAEQTWEETLVALLDDQFEVVNQAGISYHYKRYQPLNLNQ
ncbi:MAG: hypothetical protein HKP60_09445 [Eudoraea sp.]|nr:hypothetical protein [Eudoraea sp.]NNJ41080.1 hypothetical protein [Eudoraea sp.]